MGIQFNNTTRCQFLETIAEPIAGMIGKTEDTIEEAIVKLIELKIVTIGKMTVAVDKMGDRTTAMIDRMDVKAIVEIDAIAAILNQNFLNRYSNLYIKYLTINVIHT